MALAQEDIEQIRLLIKTTLSEMPETLNANVRYELDLRERTIRVEEELKHQRELMLEGFKQMEKRFEQVNKRFEQVDKRFEQVDKRFEQSDKKFEQLHQEVMGLHHEIKLLMRWSFGTLLAIGGLIVAVLRLAP
jgi:DNA repair exonuclease SbcCD ATPase subunit